MKCERNLSPYMDKCWCHRSIKLVTLASLDEREALSADKYTKERKKERNTGTRKSVSDACKVHASLFFSLSFSFQCNCKYSRVTRSSRYHHWHTHCPIKRPDEWPRRDAWDATVVHFVSLFTASLDTVHSSNVTEKDTQLTLASSWSSSLSLPLTQTLSLLRRLYHLSASLCNHPLTRKYLINRLIWTIATQSNKNNRKRESQTID